VLDRSTATLTMRQYERDPRVPLPDAEWELAKAEVKDGEVVLTPSNIDLYIKGGFKPGWIYEFIYETEGSRVMYLGFLGIRDLLSLLRYETHDAAGNPSPLAGHVEKVYGIGASLSGRVIREYVYEGWNVDAAGRRVFDAVHTHTGSGRLFQNLRFAQVGRYPRQHEEHQWPAEYEALGQDFKTRGRRLEEQIVVLRRLWTEPFVTFEGRFHTLSGVGLNQLPQQPVQIWIGCAPEEPLLRRVARVADGWLPQVDPTEPLVRLRGDLAEAGRDPARFGVTWRLVAGPGGPESWGETVRQLESVGVRDVTIGAPPDVTGAQSLQRIIEARQALAAAWY